MGSHSWVVQVGTGQSMGRSRGGITGGDLHSQRYFCPYDDLEACKPDPKHGVELSQEALRPCRSDAISNPKASAVAGEDLYVSWMGNGHVNNGQSDGTCVRLMLADFAQDPAFADFAELPGGACVDYWHYGPDGVPETSTFIQVPINTKPGTYTLLWYWNFTDFWYSSCADTEVSLDSDGSSVTTTSGYHHEASGYDDSHGQLPGLHAFRLQRRRHGRDRCVCRRILQSLCCSRELLQDLAN